MRERERQRETKRERDRDRQRERDRHREPKRERQTKRERERQTERERERERSNFLNHLYNYYLIIRPGVVLQIVFLTLCAYVSDRFINVFPRSHLDLETVDQAT